MDHRPGGDVERLARGELAGEAGRTAVRHLLRGCRDCAEQLAPIVAPEPASPDGDEYDAPISRALATVLSSRPETRPADWRLVEWGVAVVRSRPRGIYKMTDEEADRLAGWPYALTLLRLSFEERYRDPREMLACALMARIAADHLDPEGHEPEVTADRQAQAWAELANAYRVNDMLREAENAMRQAEALCRRGTGNRLLLARLADLRASLHCDQRRFPDACELLDLVHQLYLKAGDDHLAGRALVSQGIYTDYGGDPREAVRLLREGLALLDRRRDPRLVISATENLLELMVSCGDYRGAARSLLESGLRKALADEPVSLVKLRGVEGQILAGLGKLGRAEAVFQEVRAGFIQHGKPYNAALVGLYLAEVWLKLGKAAEVTELAGEMLATFRELGIQSEGVKALDFLKRACAQRLATPGLVRNVSRFVRSLEREPGLRFVPGLG